MRFAVLWFCVDGDSNRVLTPDSESYMRPAMNLLKHRVFSHFDVDDVVVEPRGPLTMTISSAPRIVATKGPYLPEVFRTPGYPAFLALVYSVVGQNPLAIIAVQCMLGVATVALVIALGSIVLGARAGWWAGLMLALDPCSIAACNFVMSDALFTLLVTVSVICTIKLAQMSHRGWLTCAGLSMAAAILCRPIGIYLPLAVAAWLAVFSVDTYRTRVCRAVGYMAVVCAVLFPWYFRNYRLFGLWGLSSIQGLNVFFAKAADLEANALGDGELANQLIPRMEARVRPERDSVPRNQLEMAAFYQSAGLRIIRERPSAFLKLHLLGTLKLLASHNLESFYALCGSEYRHMGILAAILEGVPREKPAAGNASAMRLQMCLAAAELLWIGALYGLALIGIWFSRRLGVWPLCLLLLLAIGYVVCTPGSQGIARFRVPAMPYICAVAALGVAALRRSGAADAELLARCSAK